jgi:hypothetical protein
MLISDRVRLADLTAEVAALASNRDLPPSTRDALLRVIQRVNLFAQDIVLQLNARPLIFNVDPRKYPAIVQGARPGDISVFQNDSGDVEIALF